MGLDLSRYLRLPVNADDGFPQSFRLVLGTATYAITLTVTVVDDTLLTRGRPLTLPEPGAYMVTAVTRESPGPEQVVLRRKLVPGLEYEGDELALVVLTMIVDPRNLGAPGAYGSQVVAGVSARWAL